MSEQQAGGAEGKTLLPSKGALCVAITPCLQRTLLFSSFTLGAVNRAHRVILSPGGKAVNAARALTALGGQCQLLGFCGAHTGQQFRSLLHRCHLGAELVAMAQPTRICTTLVDDQQGTVTELVEEAPRPTTHEWQAFEAKLQVLLPGYELAIAAGALPPGLAQGTYGRIAKRAAQHRTALLLDASGSALRQALCHAPLLVKLNHLELAITLGRSLETTTERVDAARRLAQDGARWVLVTQAAGTALLISQTEAWQFYPPPVRTVNPVGSGDATTAGIAFALLRGQSMIEAVRLGIACGSANATTVTAGEITARLSHQLAEQVEQRRHEP